jgi:SAM-dependent methyltransferase
MVRRAAPLAKGGGAEVIGRKLHGAASLARGQLARNRTRVRAGRETANHALRNNLYNERAMRLAEGYLRAFYRWDTYRRWRLHDTPEWFDHRADLFRFSEERRPYFLERGVYARELLPRDGRVLDLCCGDGFYPFHFYAETASHIDACDWDDTALRHARRWHSHPRISYSRSDIIVDAFPNNDYDLVVWDGAIEHFALGDIRKILEKVRSSLGALGVLCGYTILNEGPRMHPDHSHEFGSADELAELLLAVFPAAATLETEYSDRRNVYFRAATTEAALGGFRLKTR